MLKRLFRRTHRWIGLIMAAQIIAWMASGLYFSLFPIEEIRGEHLTGEAPSLEQGEWRAAGDPDRLAAVLDMHFPDGWRLDSARLHNDGRAINWHVRGVANEIGFTRLVDLRAQRVLPPLDRDEAAARARAWLLAAGELRSVEWIDAGRPGEEFRGPAPAWRVRFDEPEGVSLYLDPWTGELLARRTDRWRMFDFLWMLHIMDFDTRDDFNHPLLQVAAFLGLVIALSGLVLWLLTTPLFRRRRRASAGPSVAGLNP